MTAVHSDSGKTVLIAEYRYNGLGQRIMWRYDQNANGTVASTERFFYMYDDRWRMVGAFWDSGSTPQESFVYHAAGNAGRGASSYIDSVILRDKEVKAKWSEEATEERGERRYKDADLQAVLATSPRLLMWLYVKAWETVLRNDEKAVKEEEGNCEASPG